MSPCTSPQATSLFICVHQEDMSRGTSLRTTRLLSTPYPTHTSHLSPTDVTLQRGHVEGTVKGSMVKNEGCWGRSGLRGQNTSKVHQVEVTGEGRSEQDKRTKMGEERVGRREECLKRMEKMVKRRMGEDGGIHQWSCRLHEKERRRKR